MDDRTPATNNPHYLQHRPGRWTQADRPMVTDWENAGVHADPGARPARTGDTVQGPCPGCIGHPEPGWIPLDPYGDDSIGCPQCTPPDGIGGSGTVAIRLTADPEPVFVGEKIPGGGYKSPGWVCVGEDDDR